MQSHFFFSRFAERQVQSGSVNRFRQWPAENKIVVAQFDTRDEKSFQENDRRSEVPIVTGLERLRLSADQHETSEIYPAWPHRENVVRPIDSILEFKDNAGVDIIERRSLRDSYHGAVKLIRESQMIERSITYPIKMAALVICQVSLLTAFVWMFR